MKHKVIKGKCLMLLEQSCANGYVLIVEVPTWKGSRALSVDDHVPHEGDEVTLQIIKEAEDA